MKQHMMMMTQTISSLAARRGCVNGVYISFLVPFTNDADAQYSHQDVEKEGDMPPPPYSLRNGDPTPPAYTRDVCVGYGLIGVVAAARLYFLVDNGDVLASSC